MDEPKVTLDHLFRHEAGKLISVLTKIFGPHNLELAEDVVQDTLLKALEYWKYHGTPDNPSAWLFTAARNKALDVVRRERHHKEFAAEVSQSLKSEFSASQTLDQIVRESEIEDEQLRMMFVCCHSTIQEEGQVALILKTLCGFSVAEIAKAFLTNEEVITKRLYRAKQQFREEKIAFALPGSTELQHRLNNVLTAVYLIFSEGYNSTHHNTLIREDLVEEALRLGKMLVDHPLTCQPESLGLVALMCFQSARLTSRVDATGNLIQLKDQDRSRWNQELIQQGSHYLHLSSQGKRISPYHLQAAIAQEHCMAKNYAETDWRKILQWYDWLLEIKPDALIALNRLVAYAEVYGPKAALEELERIPDKALLQNYYLYPAAMGEWHTQLGNSSEAMNYFERASGLTRSPGEKQWLLAKINKLRARG